MRAVKKHHFHAEPRRRRTRREMRETHQHHIHAPPDQLQAEPMIEPEVIAEPQPREVEVQAAAVGPVRRVLGWIRRQFGRDA